MAERSATMPVRVQPEVRALFEERAAATGTSLTYEVALALALSVGAGPPAPPGHSRARPVILRLARLARERGELSVMDAARALGATREVARHRLEGAVASGEMERRTDGRRHLYRAAGARPAET